MITNDDIGQLEHLHLPHQYYRDFRYFAEPVPGFGIAVYTVPSIDAYCCACFPVLNDNDSLSNAFVKHVGRTYSEHRQLYDDTRKKYPYFEAPDPLTLKCLIDEAILNWREPSVQPDQAHP